MNPPQPRTPRTPDPAPERRILRIRGGSAWDDRGPRHAPGPVAALFDTRDRDRFCPGTLLAIGPADEIDRHEAWAHTPPEQRQTIDRPGSVLLPAFVNAHTHLDLSALGPRPPSDPADPSAFAAWLDMVRLGRPAQPDAIAWSVRLGVELSIRGGVAAVGDVAGAAGGQTNLEAWRTLADGPLLGVSEVEFFGIGRGEARGLEAATALWRAHEAGFRIDPDAGVRLGLQPHAPYSVAEPTFRALAGEAARWNASGSPALHLATHLAESLAERELIAHARGAQRTFLESLGLWDESLAAQVGRGRHPIEHMERALVSAAEGGSPFLCAHVHDCPPEWEGREPEALLGVLRRAGVSVAYCPRSSDAFASPDALGPHRYRAMLDAGVNVCLGTDSLVSCPPGTDRLSPLDEARRLHARDGTDPLTLLAMCTTRGARALGIDEDRCRWTVGGRMLGVVAAEGATLASVMGGESEVALLPTTTCC
ncbi:MAG: hypothetical protein EA378_01900 [Phycisphaerales bacterium]|nr:MAG: hypothetical protein EA378_01900 [Phycisphaerales bacterium]